MKLVNRVLILILAFGQFVFATKFDNVSIVFLYTVMTIYAISKLFHSERADKFDKTICEELAKLIMVRIEGLEDEDFTK